MAISPAAWWRVPGEDGIVLHSLSWAPLLLDYASISDHDTSTFDQWTLDGDYLFNNFNNSKRIHVVQDSDEIFLASWGPLAERPVKKTRFPFDDRLAGLFFKQSFYSGFFDPLKRKLFFLPVRWHAKPLNAKWTAVEERAARELRRWVQPPDEAASDYGIVRGDNAPTGGLTWAPQIHCLRLDVSATHLVSSRQSDAWRPHGLGTHRVVCTDIRIRHRS